MADHIQIGDVSPRIQYTGDGSQTAFTYPFPIFVDADMEVYEDTTLKTLTTHYTVSGAGNSSGGTVTFVTAPANGITVTLKRNIAIARTSDFQESGEFRSKVINDELDTLTASLQQVDDGVSRSLRLSATDSATSLELPDKATRSSKYLGFDANGDPVATDASGPVGPQGPGGDMSGANNLSELTNVGTARTTLGLGSAAIEDVAAGGSGGLLRNDGDGSSLTGIAAGATDAEKANIMLNAFRIAINGGLSVQQMVDGVVDEFEDETGVDNAASTNEEYDATDDFYTPVFPIIDASGESYIGDLTNTGGLAASFDGVRGLQSASSQSTSDTAGPRYVGVDWGSGNDKTIIKCVIQTPSDSHFQSGGTNDITLVLQGSTDNFSSSVVDLGTLYVGTSVQNTDYEITGLTTSTAYRYHRLKITSAGAGGGFSVAEVQLSETVANLTLISETTTALAQPDDAFIVLWQEDVEAITLNTDLKAYASRDGGTTWDLITLTEEATLSTGRILTGSVTLTSSGTSMEYKIETLNAKAQRLHGVALQWS